MGLLTGGFIRGMADQYVASKAEEREEQRQIDAEARAEERARKQADRAEQFQTMMFGRQRYFAEVDMRLQQEFQTAQAEQNYYQQSRLQQEAVTLDLRKRQEIREQAMVNAVGYVSVGRGDAAFQAVIDNGGSLEEAEAARKANADGFVGLDYDGETRLPSPSEFVLELQRRYQKGIPVVIDPSVMQIPGVEKILARYGKSGTVSTTGLLGSDPELTQGVLIKQVETPQGIQEVPIRIQMSGKDGVPDAKQRAVNNVALWMEGVAPMMSQIRKEFDNGETGPNTNYMTAYRAFSSQLNVALQEAYKVGSKDNNNNAIIMSPVDILALDKSFADEQDRQFFYENFLRPAMALSAKELAQLTGAPEEAVTFDEFTQTVIVVNPDIFTGFTERVNGKVVIKPELKKPMQDLVNFSGMTVPEVAMLTAGFKDKAKALKDLQQSRDFVLAYTKRGANGNLVVSPEMKTELKKKLKEANVQDTGEGIRLARTYIKDVPLTRPTRVVYNPNGTIKPVRAPFADAYKIDQKQAKVAAESARRTAILAQTMIDLKNKGIAGSGLVATIRRVTGGAADIATGLRTLAEQYGFGPERTRELLANADALQDVVNLKGDVGMDQVVGGQKLFDLLAEQLAFAMASALQGGSTGRAISDRDVEAQRMVLGLRGLLAGDTGSQYSLEDIVNEFGRIATIQDGYANSATSEDFDAVYFYDQSVDRARTADDIFPGVGTSTVGDRGNTDSGAVQYETIEVSPGVFQKIPRAR